MTMIQNIRSRMARVVEHLSAKHGREEGIERFRTMTLRAFLALERKISCGTARNLAVSPHPTS